ncbi:MAG TPA: MOSC domain-containing protein [Dehalococcoidia bacterium]|nr:MOSC domain-containing protein [Dehalococcoidia bacterium]
MTDSTAQQGTIAQISVSDGGVPKLPISETEIGERGIPTDRQEDLKNHGSPDQALCLYAIEVIEELQAEGHPIEAGSAGENITTAGLDWSRIVPGTRLRLGADVLIEVTKYTTPCYKNAAWFIDGDFNRTHQERFPGTSRVYARVIETGSIREGDAAIVVAEVPAEA